MPPTELERLATLESDNKNTKTLLREIKTELRRLPRRISKNTMLQLEQCRALQDSKHIVKPVFPANKIEADTDYGWLKKLLVVGMTIGSLIGGAVSYINQDIRRDKPQISQGGQQP